MARSDRSAHRAPGSTLILTMVLLTVLTVIGVAAVSLGSQARVNAAGKGKRDAMYACANAARLAIWAELAKYGSGYFAMPQAPDELTLPDGTKLTAPAHYSDRAWLGTTVDTIVLKNTVQSATMMGTQDLTNTFKFMQNLTHATTYTVDARCRDASGRELEVEFVTSTLF